MIAFRRASSGMEWLRTASCSSLCVISGPSIRVPAESESVTLSVKPSLPSQQEADLTVIELHAAVDPSGCPGQHI